MIHREYAVNAKLHLFSVATDGVKVNRVRFMFIVAKIKKQNRWAVLVQVLYCTVPCCMLGNTSRKATYVVVLYSRFIVVLYVLYRYRMCSDCNTVNQYKVYL
jgi:hypothetical protein